MFAGVKAKVASPKWLRLALLFNILVMPRSHPITDINYIDKVEQYHITKYHRLALYEILSHFVGMGTDWLWYESGETRDK